ncbi:MAG: alpha/beta hydrolase [Planctomycetes bacterium]|nr:alpha/beta hydrolase [Planctomycetota bacterium]
MSKIAIKPLVCILIVNSVPALTAPPAVPAAEGEIENRSDVVYGKVDEVELKLDWARPQGAKGGLPGVVCVHGGGWSGGKRQDFKFLVERLARSGYFAATVSYRLAPKHQFPAQVEDVKCAVSWLRAHAQELGLDPNRLGAVGGSAGGHLVLMLGVLGPGDGFKGPCADGAISSQVEAVVNLFGPADLTTRRWSEAAQGILNNFLGGTPDEKLDAYKAASPVVYITRDDPPILTFHGTADPLVPFEQAEILHRALTAAGVANRLVPMEGHGHGWGGKDLERTLRELDFFFDRHLKGRKVEWF